MWLPVLCCASRLPIYTRLQVQQAELQHVADRSLGPFVWFARLPESSASSKLHALPNFESGKLDMDRFDDPRMAVYHVLYARTSAFLQGHQRLGRQWCSPGFQAPDRVCSMCAVLILRQFVLRKHRIA